MDEIGNNENEFEDEASMRLDKSHNLVWHNYHSTAVCVLPKKKPEPKMSVKKQIPPSTRSLVSCYRYNKLHSHSLFDAREFQTNYVMMDTRQDVRDGR
jgi:hypothetical protein